MSKQKKVVIVIKNHTEKEINNFSIFNADSNKELEYSLPILEDGTPFLEFLSDLKEPENVSRLRYQFNCEDSANEDRQLDSELTIKYSEIDKKYRFKNFYSPYQLQKNIMDILGENLELRLSNDLDIVLERITPKTVLSISFIIED